MCNGYNRAAFDLPNFVLVNRSIKFYSLIPGFQRKDLNSRKTIFLGMTGDLVLELFIPDEEKALNIFRCIRWADGVYCPECKIF